MVDLILCKGKNGSVVYNASKFGCDGKDYFEHAKTLYKEEFGEMPRLCSHLSFSQSIEGADLIAFIEGRKVRAF